MDQHQSGQVPSVGRIVMYNHPGDKTGKYPPKQSPAMVLYVHADGPVDLRVNTAPTWEQDESGDPSLARCIGAGGAYDNLRVKQGDGPLQWNWPTRVP